MTAVLVGDGRGPKWSAQLERHGFGRVWCPLRGGRPQWWGDDEPWGIDCGSFPAWVAGETYDVGLFMEKLWQWHGELPVRPLWVVVPDVVTDWPATVRRAGKWLERMPQDWPRFLVLQNGATPPAVEEFVDRIDGLFLGGDDEFKGTAPMWCEFAHDAGLAFHYGRASTLDRLTTAIRIGVDSLDSTQGMWSREEWRRFVRNVQSAREQLDVFV